MTEWFDLTYPYHQLLLLLSLTLCLLLITKINTGIIMVAGYFILLFWMMIAPIVWAFNDWGWWYILHLCLAIIVYYLLWIANMIMHEKLDRKLGMGSGDIALLGVPLIFTFFIVVAIVLKLLLTAGRLLWKYISTLI